MLQVPHSPSGRLESLGAVKNRHPLQLLLYELRQWLVSRKWRCLPKNNRFAAMLYTLYTHPAPSALSPEALGIAQFWN